MPYLVTEKRLKWAPVTEERYMAQISCRAVATFREVLVILGEHINPLSGGAMAAHGADFTEKSGGTIGPLPNGVLLEVKSLTLLTLLADPDVRRRCNLATNDETLTASAVLAYNQLRS